MSFQPSLISQNHRLPRFILAVHLLSLDAVAVAVLWQQAIGQAARILPTPAERITLALAVWFIYLLDRQIDASKLKDVSAATLRHRIHRKYFLTFTSLLITIGLGLVTAAMFLPIETLRAGFILAALVAVYLAGVQCVPGLLRSGRKEVLVGLVFACGCALHAFARGAPAVGLAVTTLLAGTLFTINCLYIGVWESRIDQAQGLPALTTNTEAHLIPLTVSLALGSLLWATVALAGHRSGRIIIGTAIASASVLLLAMHRRSTHYPLTTLRIAADLALLTPLLLLPLS